MSDSKSLALAGLAAVDALGLGVGVLAGEGPLGAGLAQDGVLLRAELLTPLLVGLLHVVGHGDNGSRAGNADRARWLTRRGDGASRGYGEPHGEGDGGGGRGGRPGGAGLEPRPRDLRGDGPHTRGVEADGRRVLRVGGGRPDAGAARAADGPRTLDVGSTAGHEARDRPDGQGRRRVLPEAGAQGRSRLPRDRDDHLPLGPHGRRDLPDRDRGAGVVRPHGHPDLPSVARASRGRRPARRAAHRPRPAAGHVVHRRGAGRGRGA